jgi:predicted GIY-YIG superfamily endonuclease
MPFVYILRCADGSFYVGHTEDLATRLDTHQRGAASRFTACRLPVDMVYAEVHATMRGAISREQQLKRWTRAKKEALIAGDLNTLNAL